MIKSEHIKSAVIGLWRMGVKPEIIARELDLILTTVYNIIEEYKKLIV